MLRPLPPLNALKAFEAIARHLSFSKAADELHVTPAALSHQIHGLEEQRGILGGGAEEVSSSRGGNVRCGRHVASRDDVEEKPGQGTEPRPGADHTKHRKPHACRKSTVSSSHSVGGTKRAVPSRPRVSRTR